MEVEALQQIRYGAVAQPVRRDAKNSRERSDRCKDKWLAGVFNLLCQFATDFLHFPASPILAIVKNASRDDEVQKRTSEPLLRGPKGLRLRKAKRPLACLNTWIARV